MFVVGATTHPQLSDVDLHLTVKEMEENELTEQLNLNDPWDWEVGQAFEKI
jgi:hypothetical protein